MSIGETYTSAFSGELNCVCLDEARIPFLVACDFNGPPFASSRQSTVVVVGIVCVDAGDDVYDVGINVRLV